MNFKYVKSIIVGCYLVIATTLSVSASERSATPNLEIELLQTNGGFKTHKVAQGETAYSLARLYNVSVTDIYALNKKAQEGLKLGEEIKIPNVTSSLHIASAKSYLVKSKETLYSIAKQFDLKVDDIVNANPELKTKALSEGQSIIIPGNSNVVSHQASVTSTPIITKSFVEHVVAPKETLYGIAKQYNTTPEALIDFNSNLKDGLKQGMTILIPVLQSVNGGSYSSAGQTLAGSLRDVDAIKIGVVLPFVNKSAGRSARFIEYYEGFLLALEEMKAKGFSANVYVFDMGSETGTTKLKSLLETSEMKDLDLIVGGISPEQIEVISNFAKKQEIKYTIPFPTKLDETQKNSQIFQLNAPHNVLYRNTAKAFANIFSNANVIYITESNDKKDFVSALNNQLNQRGIKANSIAVNQNLTSNLSLALDRNRRNVIVATSGSAQLIQSLLPALNSIKTEQPATNISLFGHTEWQTYPQFFSDFYKNDTYIFTPFYLSDDDYKTKQIVSNYQKWYNNKSLINTYPKYAIMGYDAGIYFFTALFKYGKNFENSINSISIPELQTPISFDKTSVNGGYMNNGFYIVHYKTNGSVDKIEYGK